jgi:inhibitor of cysteine peptidase
MATITLTNADNGTSIEVRPEDEILMRLAENPTTGYRWQVDRADAGIEQLAASYQPAAPEQFGSPGIRELRFRVTAPLTGRLELKHWQPWEGERSVMERFSVDILPAR